VLGQPGAQAHPQAYPQAGASSPASARDLYPSASPASEGAAASAQQAPPPAASRDEPVERPSTGFAPPA
ncbi:RDD family protein, partial [Streptomyces mirabilis]